MTRVAFPAWIPRSGQPLSGLSRRVLIVTGLVFAFMVAVLLWSRWGSRGEAQLERLSGEQRRALYDRTLADLELCATNAGAALADHCAHQAELILKFHECDESCQELARAWQNALTR
jgi:hypothetical protein